MKTTKLRLSLSLFQIVVTLCMLSHASAESPANTSQRFEFTEVHMGMQTRIVVYAPDEASARSACRAAFNRIADLNETMSDYLTDSELNRLCAQAGGPPIRVSKDLFTVLSHAQKLSQISDGAFDVTAGPMVRLWRTARRSHQFPSFQELRTARSLTWWKYLVLDEKNRTVQLVRAGMQLDLGGIGKGYALDEAAKVLKAHGIKSALLEMGGDIRVSGAPPGQKGWRVTVSDSTGQDRIHELAHCGVSTSGDAYQYVELGGRRYSHIVDPRTGLGLTSQVSVSVIAPDATTSDMLATALSVLASRNPKKPDQLLQHFPEVTVFIFRPE